MNTRLSRRAVLKSTAGFALLAGVSAPAIVRAQADTIRIGHLTPLTGFLGPLGEYAVMGVKLAAEEVNGAGGVMGRKIELVMEDSVNPQTASAKAERLIERDKVAMIIGEISSASGLAIGQVANRMKTVFINTGCNSDALRGASCNPYMFHIEGANSMYVMAVGQYLLRENMVKGKKWYSLTADYAFGHDLERQATDQLVKEGGKVVGGVRTPLGTPDFSSFLLQAQTSGAQVVALAVAGGDTTNSLKQAAEFGLPAKQSIVSLIFTLNNVPALGLKASQGVLTVNPFYWDMNENTRAFSRRFQARAHNKAMPNDMQAGVYSAVLHFLKAVDKVGAATDGKAVVAAMKAMPTDDPLFGKGRIREDGRKLHPMYLLQVKSPEESKGDWDYYKVISTIPAEQAFRPMSEGNCPLVAGK